MTIVLCAVLAVLSIWDYPMKHPRHVKLRKQFVEAARTGNAAAMRDACEKGVAWLPDDPTWQYNLACSLAYYAKCEDKALDALEKAIDLGFRDDKAIAADPDLKRLAGKRRFLELVEYAKLIKQRPVMSGPMAVVEATGVMGKPIALGEQNVAWDFDVGCFVAKMALAPSLAGGNAGDLYVNRDRGHSCLNTAEFPGITRVSLDAVGRQRNMDSLFPNMLYPYPVFGNCSMAFTAEPFWRSIPRALVTTEAARIPAMMRFYLSNQVWVFPCNADCPPVGNKGDVFASVTPFWFVSAGASYTDLPILRATVAASSAFKPEVKKSIVKRGMLAPVMQALVRKSFRNVTGEADYMSPKAHPTAINGGNIDVARLKRAAASMTADAIPPLVSLTVRPEMVSVKPECPEILYATSFAWSFVLRSTDKLRSFVVGAAGASEYEFAIVHDDRNIAKLGRMGKDTARIILNRSLMSNTNRVDLAVFGRKQGTGWGAPSYVSFAVNDQTDSYCDPFLIPPKRPTEK